MSNKDTIVSSCWWPEFNVITSIAAINLLFFGIRSRNPDINPSRSGAVSKMFEEGILQKKIA